MERLSCTVQAISDTSGTVTERYVQDDPYGVTHTLDSGGSNLGDYATEVYHRKRLHGGVVDAVVGIYDFRNRWLRPEEGTWMSRDPLGPVDSWSLYQSFISSPLTVRDVMGLATFGEKVHVVAKWGFGKARAAGRCRTEAEDCVEDMPGRAGGKGDAIRHCAWICCMRKAGGADFAKDVGRLHELYNPPPVPPAPPKGFKSVAEWRHCDTKMDIHNNAEGLAIGAQDGDCCNLCKKAYDDGKLETCAGEHGYTWPSEPHRSSSELAPTPSPLLPGSDAGLLYASADYLLD